jgi:uncharacterized coiled-coil protein SlyX
MAEVSLEMLQALQQRTLDEVTSFRQEMADMRHEMRRMSGRISILDRGIAVVLSTIRAGSDTAADLQSQIDVLTERLDRLESPGT